ncbi:MAG: hypothetical protein ACOC8O_00495 [Natronomonas sp.]
MSVKGSDVDTGIRDEAREIFELLFRSSRGNALLSWPLIVVFGVVLVESLLAYDILWAAFVIVTGVVVLIPPIAYRNPFVMLPWELLILALLPILVRGLFGGELGTFSTYVSLAGLALVIAVELHTFTAVRMTHWFAVSLVVITTLASAALWAIFRWTMDVLLGTSYLLHPETTQEHANQALMIEFLYVTAAGLSAGVLFDAYFRRRGQVLLRAVGGMFR